MYQKSVNTLSADERSGDLLSRRKTGKIYTDNMQGNFYFIFLYIRKSILEREQTTCIH